MDEQTTPLEHNERERLLARIQSLEQRLVQQAQNYDALLDASPDLILFLEVNGTIIHVNRRLAERLQVSPSAAKGSSIFNYFPPELITQRKAHAQEAITTGSPVQFIDRNGERIFANRFRPVVDSSGTVIALAIFSTDITEHEQQEEHLRMLLEHSSDALVVIDGDGRQRYVSPGAERITGYPVAELEGRAIETLIHPEDLGRVMAAWNELLQHPDRTVTVQYRHVHKTRQWVHSEAIAQNFLGTPSINGVIATVRNISGQILAEKALHWSQHLLNATQRLAKVGGWEWQVTNHTMSWTEECFRIHGLTPDAYPNHSDELVNQSLACYHPQDRPVILAAFRRCIEDGTPYDLQFPFRSTDGRELWVRTMAEPVLEDGRIALVRGNIMDITREKRFEHLLAARLRLSESSASLSLDDLLATVMDEAEHLTGSAIGFFHFVNPDQQTLTLQAWSRNTTARFCRAEGKGLHYPVAEAGVWVDCLHQRQAVIHNDYASLPHRKGLPPGHAPVIRQLVVPIFRGSDVVAIFGVGNKARDYDQDDVEMVTALGNLVWDIILRKRAEEEVRQSEERFRTLLNSLPAVAIQGYRSDGIVHYWNQASEQVYGYSAEEAIGRNLLELIIPPAMRSEVRRAIAAMAESGQALEPGELTLMRHDGSGVPVFSSHLVLSDQNGVPELFCVDIDLTDSKRAAEQLRLSEERFRLSFERSPVGMVMVSTDFHYLKTNEAFCRMIGYSKEELAHLSFADITHPDERQRDLLQGQRLLAGETDRYDIEKRYIHKNGTIVWARVNITLVRDAQHQPQFFLPIIQDITAWKKAEQQLHAALDEKDVLLREVHHRVKNNLAAIISLLDMQRRLLHDTTGRDVLTELAARIRSMSLIHEQLYRSNDLAHIQFQGYLQALLSHLCTSLGFPGVHCRAEAEGVALPLDLAVPCGMIINELVTNALKYAFPHQHAENDHHDCSIRVTMHQHNHRYTLMVADNGVGLPDGFDWMNATSLGMTLVRMLGRHQLGGQLSLVNNHGLQITLTFTERRGTS